jgi:hypothetical protein
MSVIMLLTWQRVDKRWWSSSVVFSALTEQRRNMMDSASGQDGRMDLGLRDRVYMVTGGSRGLGFAAAQALVADGHACCSALPTRAQRQPQRPA